MRAQQNILALVQQHGTLPEKTDDFTGTFETQWKQAKLARFRKVRARWVDMLATEFEVKHHRKELDKAIKQVALAYFHALLRHWRSDLGRSDQRSTEQFFRYVKAAQKELQRNPALRNRLEDAAYWVNHADTGYPDDPRDEISVARATEALSRLLALRSTAEDLMAEKPPRGSHAAIRASSKPLELFWTDVARRRGTIYHSGDETTEIARFLSRCLLLFDRSAKPRTIVSAHRDNKKKASDSTRE